MVVFHQVFNAEIEVLAQDTTGMKAGKVVGCEAPAFEQTNSEGIAHDELGSCAGSGRQVIGAGLARHRCVQYYIGILSQERRFITYHAYEGVFHHPDNRKKHFNFGCITAFREANNHVVLLYNAQIAVNGIGSVHKYGGCSGRVKGGCNFYGYIGAFSNARQNNPSCCVQNRFHAAYKIIINKSLQSGNFCYFVIDSFYGNFFYFLVCFHGFFINNTLKTL
ncbi:MAG: hypothetical protein BWY70_01129 [Bacteroidetes bacterium ADurb.Bin408]|nr:MAG: hypothetical protein BWY70_01129 [Bacteroidetes bacterium ADurb.Bin408]